MHPLDAAHPHPRLEAKLRALYELRSDKTLALGFRPEYLSLLQSFNDPHLRLPPTIHVAGTNGKGSTVATLKALLEAAGKRVHVYTSPHLKRFNERIVIAGQEIDNERLEILIDRALALNGGQESTFFEITTALAFAAFSETHADYLLMETGLGGRLDCTNIVPEPRACVITSISYDHQHILGSTLPAITAEKAGIMKRRVPCVIAAQPAHSRTEGIEALLQDHAASLDVPLLRFGSEWFIEPADQANMHFSFKGNTLTLPRPSLLGGHQVYNAGNALAALFALNDATLIRPESLRNAMARISWPGRFQKIHGASLPFEWLDHAELWFDGGHNLDAARIIADQLALWAKSDPRPLHLIVGMKGDKDAQAFLKGLVPYVMSITHVDLEGVGHFLGANEFFEMTSDLVPDRTSHKANLNEALLAIRNKLDSNESVRVLICGSLYLAKQLP